jgi:hypothetical protein
MPSIWVSLVVVSAFQVPTVIVRQAACRSKVRLQVAILNDSEVTTKWFGLNASEAQTRLDKMTCWPIRYAQPAQPLVLMVPAGSCFFAYKLTMILVAAILYQGLQQFRSVFQR